MTMNCMVFGKTLSTVALPSGIVITWHGLRQT